MQSMSLQKKGNRKMKKMKLLCAALTVIMPVSYTHLTLPTIREV